jgi:hypothetical protein
VSRSRSRVAAAAAVVGLLALAGCTPGLYGRKPLPAPSSDGPTHAPPTAEDPLRVLLLGDGVMFDAEPGLTAAFESTGVAAVSTGSMWGFGLTHPELVDFRSDWPARVDAARPDLVVVLLGPWDIRASLGPTDDAWSARYADLLDEAHALLTSGGAEVWWLPMLPEPGVERGERIAALARAVAELDGRHGDVLAPDVRAAFSGPDGAYVAGAAGRVWRKPDGEHLCPDGVVHLFDALRPALASRYGVDPPRTWETGPWTADVRFRWEPGNSCP